MVTNEVKGPDPAVWSDDARSERGADRDPDVIAAEGPQFGTDGEPVKGPDPVHWDDPARSERGAELGPEQAEIAGPNVLTDEESTTAKIG